MKRRISDLDLSLPDAREFHLAMTKGARDEIWSWLHGPKKADTYERGLLCVLTRSPGKQRLSYLVREVLPPEEAEIDYSVGVQFSRRYRRRAKDRADSLGGGLLYLHTHPGGDGCPSRQDVEGGRRLLHNDAQHLQHPNPPLAIGIVTPDENWMVLGCEYPKGTSVSEGEMRYATAIRVAGRKLQKLKSFTGRQQVSGPAGAVGSVDPQSQERQIRLWTTTAQRAYAALRVGLVGLGGGGSILAEHLARAGVGGLVLVDFDVVKQENLNRQQGASAVDASVWQPKVDAAARAARKAATNPAFEVRRVYGSVVEDDPDLGGFRDLLDSDVILHAADGDWPTQVLDQVAYGHLIPVISGGTRPDATDHGVLTGLAKSPITVSGPGHPCFRCTGQFRETKAVEERHGGRPPGPDYDLADGAIQSDEESPTGSAEEQTAPGDKDDGPAPSVISLNCIVAGMMHLRLQDLTLGVTGQIVGERRFLPGRWDVVKGRTACSESCDRGDLEASGQTHRFPLSSDPEFAKLRDEVTSRFTPYW